MRQKVIVYKSDGNAIRERVTELEPKREHVFFGKRHEAGCGQDDVEIVLCVEGTYFVEAYRLESSLQDSLLDALEEYAVHFKSRILSDERIYPSLVMLEVFRRHGTEEETSILLRRKERILREREEEEEKRRQERKRKKEEAERQHETDYARSVETFRSGKSIAPEWLVEMAGRNGVKLHPKTVHNLYSHCKAVSICGISVTDRKRSYQGVFNAIRSLQEKLNP